MQKVFLLGEQRIWKTDSASQPIASRPLELLAYLALHTGVEVPRQYLAGLLWPDSADHQSLTNLRRELHHLRGLLDDGGDAGLRTGRTTLSWTDSPDCRVDVCVFRAEHAVAMAAHAAGDRTAFLVHAQNAIDEYRGDLLPGVLVDWVLEQRDVLRRECVQLCDRAAAGWREADDLEQAAALAQRRVRLEPLEESGYRLLMELQSGLGDRGAAMTTFHRCATMLEQELGVRPDPSTTALLGRMFGTAEAQFRPKRQATAADRPGPPLVGREHEVVQLEDRWRLALDHQPGLLLITGEAGVGKTRLTLELMALGRASGAVVAQSRCFSRPGRIPMAPVADWLRSPQMASSLPSLAPVWRSEVNRLLPGLAQEAGNRDGRPETGNPLGHPDAGTPDGADAGNLGANPANLSNPANPGGGPGRVRAPNAGAGMPGPNQPPATSRAMVDAWQRHRFFEALARAVLVSGRPVLLVLDDLQWGDAETMSWLAFLFGYARQSRLLVAATARPEELGQAPDLLSILHPMESAGLITRLRLDPLTPEGTADLAASLTGRQQEPEEAALLFAATGGYPLYIVEAARMLPDAHGPTEPPGSADLQSVLRQSVLRRRLDQASEAARSLAGLAAAYGQDVGLELLSEAGDLTAQELVTAVDELWRLRILRTQGHGYDFVHDLLRETAYQAVTPARRWLLHRRLAQALEVLYSGRLDDVAAQLGEQYSLGGQGGRALQYYRRAGEVAAGVFANVEALKYYRRCLDIITSLPPGENRNGHELGVLRAMSAPLAALHGYSSPELQSTLDRTAELAQQLDQPEVLLSSLIGLFASRFVQGQTALSFRIAERALALARSHPDLLGQAHFAYAGAALSLGRPEDAITHFDAAVGLSLDKFSYILGTKLEVHARAWCAHARWLTGDDAGAMAGCEDALERGRAAGHPYSLAVALGYASVLYQLRNDPVALAPAAAELQDICRRYNFAYYGQWGAILSGWLAGGQTGAEAIRAGIRTLRALGAFARMPYWLGLLAETRMACGQPERAGTALDAAMSAAGQHDDRWWLPEVLRLRSLMADGDHAAELLAQARQLAQAQHSFALVARCDATTVSSVPFVRRPGQ